MTDDIAQIKTFLQQIGFVSPWITIPLSCWEPLISQVPQITIKRGQTMIHKGNSCRYVYIVKSGRLRIHFENWEGSETCIFIAEKGCLVGETSVLDHADSFYSADAIVDTVLYKVEGERFRDACMGEQALSMQVMALLCRKIRLLNSKMEHFTQKAGARVALALLSVCVEYGTNTEDGVALSIRFTHEEVANLTSLNRVTVSRLYTQLIRDGVLHKSQSGHLVITDVAYLIRIAS